MKFNIGDTFYTFDRSIFSNSFTVRRYTVIDMLIGKNNKHMFRDYDSRWFTEKECLTKEEVIEKINDQIKKIEKRN